MKTKKYYRSVRYSKRNTSTGVAVALGIILAVFLGLAVWAVAVFHSGGDGAFENQTKQLSNLKIEVERLKTENRELKEEIEKYKNGEYDKKEEEQITPEEEPEEETEEETEEEKPEEETDGAEL